MIRKTTEIWLKELTYQKKKASFQASFHAIVICNVMITLNPNINLFKIWLFHPKSQQAILKAAFCCNIRYNDLYVCNPNHPISIYYGISKLTLKVGKWECRVDDSITIVLSFCTYNFIHKKLCKALSLWDLTKINQWDWDTLRAWAGVKTV